MHTITVCPRCNKDFMYHSSDTHLHRNVAWDADTKEPCSFETICQDCDLEEKWVGKEVKVKGDNYDTHLNKYKLVVTDIVDEDFPITVKIGDTDSYEWFQEDQLEIVSKTNLERLQFPELVREMSEYYKDIPLVEKEVCYTKEDLEVAFFHGQLGRDSFNDWFEQF